MDTVEWRIEKSKGYDSRGYTARKSYIAEITGTDPQYGFARDFRDADEIDWGDSKLYKRSKGHWEEVHHVGPGLYERCQHGDREFRIVFTKKDGAITWCAVDKARAKAIAMLLNEGMVYDEARRATKPAASKIEAPQEGAVQ